MTPAVSPKELLARAGRMMPPTPPPPAGTYSSANRFGSTVRTSGQVALIDGVLLSRGRIGNELSIVEGIEAAGQATLNALAAAATRIRDLSEVSGLVSMTVYIACTPEFRDHVAVADGGSQILAIAFPGLEPPVRSAVGVASLPLNASVEIELVLEV